MNRLGSLIEEMAAESYLGMSSFHTKLLLHWRRLGAVRHRWVVGVLAPTWMEGAGHTDHLLLPGKVVGTEASSASEEAERRPCVVSRARVLLCVALIAWPLLAGQRGAGSGKATHDTQVPHPAWVKAGAVLRKRPQTGRCSHSQVI